MEKCYMQEMPQMEESEVNDIRVLGFFSFLIFAGLNALLVKAFSFDWLWFIVPTGIVAAATITAIVLVTVINDVSGR